MTCVRAPEFVTAIHAELSAAVHGEVGAMGDMNVRMNKRSGE